MRRHKIVKDDCFLIFGESAPEDTDAPHIKESAAIKVDCFADGGSVSGGEEPWDGLSGDWQGGETQPRYVQFAFRQDCFYMELPNATLFLSEAEQILRHQLGFYWAKNRPDLRWVRGVWKDMVKWNPLQKVYLYGDEQSAAEDMAFILFDMWKFPVDWRWYITAASFRGGHQFARGLPLI